MESAAIGIALLAVIIALVALLKAGSVAKRLQALEAGQLDAARPADHAGQAPEPGAIDTALNERLAKTERQATDAIELAEQTLDLVRREAPAQEPPPAKPAPPPPKPDRPDLEVTVRASEILAEAKRVAMLISFDFAGDRTGQRVPIQSKTELDEQALAHLKDTEKAVLDVVREGGETFIVLDSQR